jgi:hypothetical protein
MAIPDRKNTLSYKSLNEARTGDLFVSLIDSWRPSGANPFDHLMATTRHPQAVKLIPGLGCHGAIHARLPPSHRRERSRRTQRVVGSQGLTLVAEPLLAGLRTLSRHPLARQ